MHNAAFSLQLGGNARTIRDAIAIEAEEGPEGTTLALSLEGETLHLELTATDLSGLRAAIHSALRLIDAAQRTTTVSGKD